MRGTTAPRLLLELIAARMLLPGADDSHGALLQRLERMERRLTVAAEPVESAGSGRRRPRSMRFRWYVLRPASVGQAARLAGRPRRRARQATPALPAKLDPRARARTAARHHRRPQSESAPARSAPLGVLDAAAVRRVWDEVLTTIRRRSPNVMGGGTRGDGPRRARRRDRAGLPARRTRQHVRRPGRAAARGAARGARRRWQVRAELGGDERTVNRQPRPHPPHPHGRHRPRYRRRCLAGDRPAQAAGSAPADPRPAQPDTGEARGLDVWRCRQLPRSRPESRLDRTPAAPPEPRQPKPRRHQSRGPRSARHRRPGRRRRAAV